MKFKPLEVEELVNYSGPGTYLCSYDVEGKPILLHKASTDTIGMNKAKAIEFMLSMNISRYLRACYSLAKLKNSGYDLIVIGSFTLSEQLDSILG